MFKKVIAYFRKKDLLEAKKETLTQLNADSISSIATMQNAVNNLATINTDIDKTKQEIEKIESDFTLIKGELDTRRANNAVIIDHIKKIMEK